MPKPDSCKESCCQLENPEFTKLTDLAVNNSAFLEICSCRPWNRSGIHVKKGQRYVFSTERLLETWVDGNTKSNPSDGWTGHVSNFFGVLVSFLKRSDKANWYALVGAVSKDEKDTFIVLTDDSSPIKMDKSGELYFYANDMKGRYFNNKGILKLKITRIEDCLKKM
jgi:hypothetical protein